MKKLSLFLLISILLTACSGGFGFSTEGRAPTPAPVQSPTPAAAASVTLIANPPAGTPADVGIALELLDDLTTPERNSRLLTMERTPQGQYRVELTPALGTVLYYRFIRLGPDASFETTPAGEPAFRRAHVLDSQTLEDTLAGWADASYSGGVGRITGTVISASDGQPLAEIAVFAGGQTTFSDQAGRFQFNGLQPGYHRITLISPSGAYQTAQQGAYVDVDSATPASFVLEPALAVQVAFQVTVPADTLPGSDVRLMANARQCGFRFTNAGAHDPASPSVVPQLMMVDETHYIFVTTLYAGMDLRYKYTLGDGDWNAEHDPDGNYVTRQVIVPDSDLVLEDSVSTWHSDNQATVRFHVMVPANTPDGETVSLQLEPAAGLPPIPMWRLGEDEWYYILYSPLEPGETLRYRYCRNGACGSADDARTTGESPSPLTVEIAARAQNVEDEVSLWQWLGLSGTTSTVVAPDIQPRSGMRVGVAFLPRYDSSWLADWSSILTQLENLSANSVILMPAWRITTSDPTPLFHFDPAVSPFTDELETMRTSLGERGIAVSLQPELLPADSTLQDWWQTSVRTAAWWNVWFEQYQAFILNYADLAQELNIERLVLGGAAAAPALPGGLLPDGSPSLPPQDAAERWESLLAAVRARYPGTLAFDIEFSGNVDVPDFLASVDEVQLHWRAPLSDSGEGSIADLQAAAGDYLNRLQASPILRSLPVSIVVEFLAIDGAATGCAPSPDGSCRPADLFDRGAPVDSDLSLDLEEQARSINAILLAMLSHEEIHGFYVGRYNPAVALQDKSASVHGKPAADVLWYWYPRLAP